MISSVDERGDVEDQIIQKIWIQIARGAYAVGEPLPSPESVARELLVNPRRVQAAYRRLGADNLVVFIKGQGHVVQLEARDQTRARLTDRFRDELRATLAELREVGCPGDQLRDAINAALQRER